MLVVLLVLIALLLAVPLSGGTAHGAPQYLVRTVLFAFACFAGITIVIVALAVTANGWEKRNTVPVPSLSDRLPAFAAANGLNYSNSTVGVRYPGALFSLTGNSRAIHHLSARSGRFFDLGDFEISADADRGGEAPPIRWGYIAIDLGRPLPNMLMECKRPFNQRMHVQLAYDRRQVETLEGDFNSYFTLYSPHGYSVDARYIFTPDLMGLLVDEAGDLHVELIDTWLLVYVPQGMRANSVEDYERMFRIVEVVGRTAVRQTQRYVDERVTSGRGRHVKLSVSLAGRRLSLSMVFWIKAAAIVAGTIALCVACNSLLYG
jgi:hypothetical protein